MTSVSAVLTLYQCSLHSGTLFCTPVENTSWFGAGKKKRRLMRGWGKHHFLMLAADLRKKYFLRETIKR